MAGEIVAFNESVLNDPSAINTDNYSKGWLFDIRSDVTLLTPQEYVAILDEGWERTQQTIKGQMN